MYHKVIHKKYNDNTASVVAKNIAMMGVIIISYIIMLPLPINNLKVILPNVFGLGSFLLMYPKVNYYEERRADVEGLYAMSCYQCVSDVSKYLIRKDNNEGYLNNTEISQIATVLKQQSKLCKDHSYISNTNINK